jgi:hypothetical protein
VPGAGVMSVIQLLVHSVLITMRTLILSPLLEEDTESHAGGYPGGGNQESWSLALHYLAFYSLLCGPQHGGHRTPQCSLNPGFTD